MQIQDSSRTFRAMALLAPLLLSACGGGGGGEQEPDTIDPTNAQALTDALEVKVPGFAVSVIQNASPPSPSGGAQAPVASPVSSTISARAGERVDVNVSVVSSGASNLERLFAKIPGASDYFQAQVEGGAKAGTVVPKAASELTVSLTLPEQLSEGRFCVEISAQDDANRVSDVATACVDVVKAEASLQGAYRCGLSAADSCYIVFFSDGRYVQGESRDSADTDCDTPAGPVEFGTYTWDPATGAFNVGTPIVDNCDDAGFGGPSPGMAIVKNADGSLSFTAPDDSEVFSILVSQAGGLIGAFQSGESGTSTEAEPTVIVFMSGGKYFLMSTSSRPEEEVYPGIEDGCYSTTTANDQITLIADTSPNCQVAPGIEATDTTGTSGFTSPNSPGQDFLFEFDGPDRILGRDSDDVEFVTTRIPRV
ncbi:MAG TPA: hypothetical protein VGE51_14175 [Fontimonas sp.]